ncbi:hypothetical protein F5Y04DRAFT_17447 [Hypomontagnella monticulosa]|nr:hypothetical protein F5Y04DRAFT_17447 [Hypomontagnella monticulosa]
MGRLLSTTKLALFIISVTGARIASGTAWAQFCSDDKCSEKCGTSVDISNPGCLTGEAGRGSIAMHGAGFLGAYLVHSPDDHCGCQADCTKIPGAGSARCINISSKARAESYRFQLTTCSELEGGPGIGNNCNATSTLPCPPSSTSASR